MNSVTNKEESIEDFVSGLQRKLRSKILKHNIKKDSDEDTVTIEFLDEAGYPEEYYVVSNFLFEEIKKSL
ncbi:MAG: hypothetical protein HGGPFJEG_01459 [Ignavibacteria bacterium]|nr:hypothetical protein [Ignavibacteria bacterium]